MYTNPNEIVTVNLKLFYCVVEKPKKPKRQNFTFQVKSFKFT